MNANPWKDPLYRLIDEYGGLAIPKGEREEWREVIPLGLRRKYRAARQPDAFVQACIEDGRCQAFGIRDTRDLHDQLTARLHHLRGGLRLATEADIDGEEDEGALQRQLRRISTVVGAEVPRGRRHQVTVYETSPVLWERSERSRSKRSGVAVNPHRRNPWYVVHAGTGLAISGPLANAQHADDFIRRAIGDPKRTSRAPFSWEPRWYGHTVPPGSRIKKPATPQVEAFKTRDIVPFIIPTRIPAKVEQDLDPLRGFRQPEPEKQMRMFNPVSRVRNEKLARALAIERGVSYGLSVIDGWYYVGTSKELAAVGALHRSNGRVNPAVQHSPDWRKGFTAGIAAKARGAVRGNPLTRGILEGTSSWGLRVGGKEFAFLDPQFHASGGSYRGYKALQAIKRLIGKEVEIEYSEPTAFHPTPTVYGRRAVRPVKRNPLTRRETAKTLVRMRTALGNARAAHKYGLPTMSHFERGRAAAYLDIARSFGKSAFVKTRPEYMPHITRKGLGQAQNPLTRRETAGMLRKVRTDLREAKRHPVNSLARAYYTGMAQGEDRIARSYGQAGRGRKHRKQNPLTRRETALVLREARRSRKRGIRERAPYYRGLSQGIAAGKIDIARRFGAGGRMPFTFGPRGKSNPGKVVRSNGKTYFNGSAAQAKAYANRRGVTMRKLTAAPAPLRKGQRL